MLYESSRFESNFSSSPQHSGLIHPQPQPQSKPHPQTQPLPNPHPLNAK